MSAKFSYKNDSDEGIRGDPQETASELQDQEQQSGFDRDFKDLTDPEHLAKDGKEGDIGEDESKGSWNYAGNKSKPGRTVTPMNVRAILKKRGPLGLILAIGLGGGIAGTALFSPGILLVQMKESLTDRFNTQLASMDSRTSRLISSKVSGSTSGICSARITIACKYSTISEKQALRLKNAGITVEGDTKFGNRIKPTSYKFAGESIAARDFTARMASDVNLRSAMRQAYNPKYGGFADKIWSGVSKKLGISKVRALVDGDADAKTKGLEESVKNGKSLNISADGVTCDGDTCVDKQGNTLTPEQKAARQAAIEASGEVAEEVAEDSTKAALSAAEGGAKAGLNAVGNFVKVTGALDTACQAYSAVRGLGYAAKTIRAIQLARYAMVFINTADQIKAGTAKPEDVAYLGGILTSLSTDVASGITRKAAMDSAGMKYSMFGDTSGFRGQGASYISQFMAGGGLTGDLIAITGYIDSVLDPVGGAKSTCRTLSNGWVQAGSVVAGLALMLIPGVNVVVTAADIAKATLSVGAGIGMAILPDLLKDIVAGNVMQGAVGEDSGNGIASGFGVISSSVAQAGGNAPMSVEDAVGYTTLNSGVVASYSADEASQLSPLDPTSKNTFIGSIVHKLLPYASSTGSLANPLFAAGALVSSSFASIVPSAAAVTTAQQEQALTMCNDPDRKDLGVAADPFCNLVFGLPERYLNRDPVEVSKALAGQFDDITGAPVSGSTYADYVTNCINRLEPIGSGGTDDSGNDGMQCKINDANANYYLFYMDQRIDAGMDGYFSESSAEVASADIDQAKVYEDSTNVDCAEGTTDAGTEDGYRNGQKIPIRLCSIPGTSDNSHGGEPLKVNSRVSGATLALTKGLAEDRGVTDLRVADGFRTMAEQEQALAEYGPGRAAQPGYSNHQMGLAIDFQLGSNDGATRPGDPVYDWLVKNAKGYGFGKIAGESWHWQALGADYSVAMQ